VKGKDRSERQFPDLYLMRKSTHKDTVPRQLAHITGAELPDLRRNAILFHERFLGEMELERVVCGEANHETSGQVLR
jgi:hypothetical protein